jgi:MFS family permease
MDTAQSWRIAVATLAIMTVAFGGPWIAAVALKDIAAEVNSTRAVPAFASAITWLGVGTGGILMGRVANRFGTRLTVIIGALMIAIGLGVSTLGATWPLWIGHGLFIGMLGLGGINAPLFIYVSRWFDRRRGSALALISSGSYLAGALWPPLFEPAISAFGWRHTMLGYAAIEVVIVVPLAVIFLQRAPDLPPAPAIAGGQSAPRVLGLNPWLAFGLLCAAGVCCCIPMAIPQNHLVAFCSDLGFSRSFGAVMLSIMLGAAFISRQVWGLFADRFGGIATILAGSTFQATCMAAFLFTVGEFGLITVSAAFGLGFSGIIPAYALAARELFAARESYWRIPTVLMSTQVGMAIGGWGAGILYDHFGFYGPAFAAGIAANAFNIIIVAFLVSRARGGGSQRLAAA